MRTAAALLLSLIALPLFADADLRPEIKADPLPATARTSTYWVYVHNDGPGEALNVSARVTFAGDISPLDRNYLSYGCTLADSRTMVCTEQKVLPGQYAAFFARVAPQSAGGHLVVTASVTSQTPDPNPANDSATYDRLVAGNAELRVTVTAPDEVDAQGNITQTYTIRNASPYAANRVIANVAFVPPGTQIVGATNATCGMNPFVYGVTCNVPDIAAGDAATFTVTFHPPRPAIHFTSDVSILWDAPDLQFRTFNYYDAILYAPIVVTTASDNGAGSLRAAINEANTRCAAEDTPCRITFSQPYSVEVITPLPALTAPEMVIQGKAELLGKPWLGNGFTLAGRVATLRDLTIRGFENGVLANAPRAIPGTALTIERCELTGHSWRGVVANTYTTTIKDSVLSGNGRSGAFVSGGELTVTSSRFEDNGASGIYSAARLKLSDNVIQRNREFGVALPASVTGSVIGPNSIYDNGISAIDFGLDGPSDPHHPFRPKVTSARYDAASGDTVIAVEIDRGTGATTRIFSVYVYANDALNRSGRAEAQKLVATMKGGGEVRVHADLRGKWITAANSAFYDYYGELQETDSSELSDGVEVF